MKVAKEKSYLKHGKLHASKNATNPKDARYGDGQYLSDIEHNTKSPSELSAAFLKIPWQGKRFSNFISIDVTGLHLVKGRQNVFVIPNTKTSDLHNRIIGSGQVQKQPTK